MDLSRHQGLVARWLHTRGGRTGAGGWASARS